MPEGMKDAVGKPKINKLIKEVLWEMQKVHEYGDNKYAEGNWRLGIPNAGIDLLEATIRHILDYWDGNLFDKESGLYNLAHAMVDLSMVLYYELNKEVYKDCLTLPVRPKREKE